MTEAHRWGRQAVSREFCPSAWLGCATWGLLGQQDLQFLPEEAGFVLWVAGGGFFSWRGQGHTRESGEQGVRWEGHLGKGPLSPGSSTRSGISGEWLGL